MEDTSEIKVDARVPRIRFAQSDSQNDQSRGNVLSKGRVDVFSSTDGLSRSVGIEEQFTYHSLTKHWRDGSLQWTIDDIADEEEGIGDSMYSGGFHDHRSYGHVQ